MHIVHVFSALYQGGAETQLELLINHSLKNNPEVKHTVISLKRDVTPLWIRLEGMGVTVLTCNLDSPLNLYSILTLRRILSSFTSSDIIQCWMYHANFLATVASIGLRKKLIWNIRRTQIPIGITGLIARLSARLSFLFPVKIVCCATAAKESHIELGYNPDNMTVIHNGIDTERFVPNKAFGISFRSQIGIEKGDFVLGVIGRYAPVKGHVYLLQAFRELMSNSQNINQNIKLVMIGRNIANASELLPYLRDKSLKEHLIIIPERTDIHKLIPALDLLCLPSESEGFPNVVAEAMSCGVPTLVSDVGDAAFIVNNTDMVVLPCDSSAIAKRIEQFIKSPNLDKFNISKVSRERVIRYFSVEESWRKYLLLYK